MAKTSVEGMTTTTAHSSLVSRLRRRFGRRRRPRISSAWSRRRVVVGRPGGTTAAAIVPARAGTRKRRRRRRRRRRGTAIRRGLRVEEVDPTPTAAPCGVQVANRLICAVLVIFLHVPFTLLSESLTSMSVIEIFLANVHPSHHKQGIIVPRHNSFLHNIITEKMGGIAEEQSSSLSNVRRWTPVNNLKNSRHTIQIHCSVTGQDFNVPEKPSTSTGDLTNNDDEAQGDHLLGSTSLHELIKRVKCNIRRAGTSSPAVRTRCTRTSGRPR